MENKTNHDSKTPKTYIFASKKQREEYEFQYKRLKYYLHNGNPQQIVDAYNNFCVAVPLTRRIEFPLTPQEQVKFSSCRNEIEDKQYDDVQQEEDDFFLRSYGF